MTAFGEHDALYRFIETAAALIRAAKARDQDLLERQLHQLVNIVSGWILSAGLDKDERARLNAQAELELQQPRKED